MHVSPIRNNKNLLHGLAWSAIPTLRRNRDDFGVLSLPKSTACRTMDSNQTGDTSQKLNHP